MNALHRLLGRLREHPTPPPREYESSPHTPYVPGSVWCYHEDGRKHLLAEAGAVLVHPCDLPAGWTVCGVGPLGMCWRADGHRGRHSSATRTWPNDGPTP